MIAMIDNKPMKVIMIDKEYDLNRVEVEIIEGCFKGARCIVNKKDLMIPVTKDTKQVIVKKQGIHFNKQGSKVRVLRTGAIECLIWSDRQGGMVWKRYEAHEVSAYIW